MKLPRKIAMLLTVSLIASNGVGSLAYGQNNNVNVEKLVGEGRWETAIEISKEGWDKSDIAIMVNDSSIADALSATPFAKQKNAPILLTGKNKLKEKTKEELKRLGVKKVYLIGGEDVLHTSIEEELKLEKIEFERISGVNREETSLKIARLVDLEDDISEIAVVNGYSGLADAVSIGAAAAEKNMPIILAHPQKGTKVYDEFIKQEEISTSYVIGGKDTISQSIEDSLPNSTRIGGIDRNETNAKVIEEFYKSTTLKNAYIAKDGIKKEDHLIDALAVGVLAAKNNSPVIIVGNKLKESQENIIRTKKFKKITQIGGNGHELTIEEITKLLRPNTSSGGSGGNTSGGNDSNGGITNQDKEQLAPTGLKGIAETGEGKNDGKIIGLKEELKYEYKKVEVEKNTNSYILIEGTTEITDLEPGTYYVRFPAKDGFKVGEDATIIVGNYISEDSEQDSQKTPLEILEEQIKAILGKIKASISEDELKEINQSIINIENILKDGISKDDLTNLIPNIGKLLGDIDKVVKDNTYIKGELSQDLKDIINTLDQVIRTSEKLQQLKEELKEELKELNIELDKIINGKKTQIEDFIDKLEDAKEEASEDIKAIIATVENKLNEFYTLISDGVTKEEIQSVITVLNNAISQLEGKSPELTQVLTDIKIVFENTLDGYIKVENTITKVEQIVDSIENIDTTSIKGFISTTKEEVNKLPEGTLKDELLNTLDKADKVIQKYEIFEETMNKIKQTDNPLQAIQIIATSGLITKENITEVKVLLEYVEDKVNSLPDGELKPVAQLGLTSLKVVVELVETNQNGNSITNVVELIQFILNSESVTLENLKQARAILENIGNIVDKMPDSEIKTQINGQLKTFKDILDVAISLEEEKEAINKAIERAEASLSVLNEALKDLTTLEKIEEANNALNNFKETLKTNNPLLIKEFYDRYNDRVKEIENTIQKAELVVNNVGLIKVKVESSAPSIDEIEGLDNVNIVVKDLDGNVVESTKSEKGKGNYELRIKPGKYIIEFSEGNHSNFKTETIDLDQGQILEKDIRLNKLVGVLTGRVSDLKTKAGLNGVKVEIKDENGDTIGYDITKKVIFVNGVYRIENIPVGNYTITCSLDGYTEISQPITINPGENIDFNISMSN